MFGISSLNFIGVKYKEWQIENFVKFVVLMNHRHRKIVVLTCCRVVLYKRWKVGRNRIIYLIIFCNYDTWYIVVEKTTKIL